MGQPDITTRKIRVRTYDAAVRAEMRASVTRAQLDGGNGTLTLSASKRLNVFPHPWQTFDWDRDVWRAWWRL